MKIIGRGILQCLCAAAAFLAGCSQSNNLLLGRVRAAVGGHVVVVTDCYRTSVPAPQRSQDSAAGEPSYRFTPCRDADVLIRGDQLSVNGHSYGHLDPADGILVDHGVVSVHRSKVDPPW
jgi:hypothetical protein